MSRKTNAALFTAAAIAVASLSIKAPAAPPVQPTTRPQPTEDLNDLTKPQLIERAALRNVTVRKSWTKSQIIVALTTAA